VAGDRAFDNTASTGMGSAGVGGYGSITSGSSVFSGLSSFTITGWYNSSVNPSASGARMMSSANGAEAVAFTAAGGLNLTVDATNLLGTSANYLTANKWIYYAVTYDGTLTSNNVKFYYGDTATAVSASVATGTINMGAVDAISNNLFLGNRGTTGDRPFDGYMDDFRVYSGVANASFLNTVRLQAVPEPSAGLLILAGVGMILLRRKS
jgi:hypothetical protein